MDGTILVGNSTAMAMTYELSRLEGTIVGTVYVVLATMSLATNVVTFVLFLGHEDLRAQNVYRIMLSIGIADVVQLISHFYAGTVAINGSKWSPEWDQILAGAANAAWIANIAQMLVLAIERFLIFTFSNYQSCRKGATMYLNMMVACWLFGGAFFAIYLTDKAGLIFDFKTYAFGYDSSPWSGLVARIEYYTSLPLLFATMAVYGAICWTILVMRSESGSRSRTKHAELRLLFQSFLIFAYALVVICCWHHHTVFLPNSPWTSITINILWICFGALNPLLYLTMNRRVGGPRHTCEWLMMAVFSSKERFPIARCKFNCFQNGKKALPSMRNRSSLRVIDPFPK